MPSQARFERAHLKSLSDSVLFFEIVYYVTSADYNLYMDVQQNINLSILRQFAEKNFFTGKLIPNPGCTGAVNTEGPQPRSKLRICKREGAAGFFGNAAPAP
jgi:hypothetical protein